MNCLVPEAGGHQYPKIMSVNHDSVTSTGWIECSVGFKDSKSTQMLESGQSKTFLTEYHISVDDEDGGAECVVID